MEAVAAEAMAAAGGAWQVAAKHGYIVIITNCYKHASPQRLKRLRSRKFKTQTTNAVLLNRNADHNMQPPPLTYRISQHRAHSNASARGSLMSRAMMLRSGRGGAGGRGSNGHAVDADITETAREISGRRDR